MKTAEWHARIASLRPGRLRRPKDLLRAAEDFAVSSGQSAIQTEAESHKEHAQRDGGPRTSKLRIEDRTGTPREYPGELSRAQRLRSAIAACQSDLACPASWQIRQESGAVSEANGFDCGVTAGMG